MPPKLPKLPGMLLPSSPLDTLRGIIHESCDQIAKAGNDIRTLATEIRTSLSDHTPSSQSVSPLPSVAPANISQEKSAVDEDVPEEIQTQDMTEKIQAQDIATACVPCSVGHLSTCAGLLNEAARFKKEGLTSNQVMDDVGKCIMELNALERVDLTPEKIQKTKGWERPIAEEALQQSRNLRHRLESVENMEELEEIAADTHRYYTRLNRQWYRGRFSNLGDKKAESIAERVGGEA